MPLRRGIVAAALLAMASCGCRIAAAPEPRFAPSTPGPRELPPTVSAPIRLTVDARDSTRWAYVDFSRASVVVPRSPLALDWDLAVRRYHLRTNGGRSNPSGEAGIVDLGPVAYDSVAEAPVGGFVPDAQVRGGEDPKNPVLSRWYEYGFWTNILRSKRHVYVIRTADARFAKFRVVSYYCEDGESACLTLEFVYQGDGSRRFR